MEEAESQLSADSTGADGRDGSSNILSELLKTNLNYHKENKRSAITWAFWCFEDKRRVQDRKYGRNVCFWLCNLRTNGVLCTEFPDSVNISVWNFILFV